VYGRTKRDGEQAVLAANDRAIIVRTSWLYAATHKNFRVICSSFPPVGPPPTASDASDSRQAILHEDDSLYTVLEYHVDLVIDADLDRGGQLRWLHTLGP
jgi:hypothetical protein